MSPLIKPNQTAASRIIFNSAVPENRSSLLAAGFRSEFVVNIRKPWLPQSNAKQMAHVFSDVTAVVSRSLSSEPLLQASCEFAADFSTTQRTSRSFSDESSYYSYGAKFDVNTRVYIGQNAYSVTLTVFAMIVEAKFFAGTNRSLVLAFPSF